MKNLLKLIRPHQWLKNVFCFLPLFFDGKAFEAIYFIPAIFAFFAFSFAASGIYCFNDIYDVEADKIHPIKCKRPIASGAIKVHAGYLIMACCLALSMIFTIFSPYQIDNGLCMVLSTIAFYIVLNIAYCMLLKRKPIVDVFTISIGFVLRLLVGGFSTGIWMSHWIILMTFLLALFLAFAKRRDDVVIYEETGVKARKNIDRYNVAFMNQAIGIIASITMVCYILYTVSPEVVERFSSPYVYLTSIFVLAGIIRYLQITIVDIRSGSPTKVLMKDRFIQFVLLGWVLSFLCIIYI